MTCFFLMCEKSVNNFIFLQKNVDNDKFTVYYNNTEKYFSSVIK